MPNMIQLPPLHKAVYEDDFDTVIWCMADRNLYIDLREPAYLCTALHIAVHYEHFDIAMFLLYCGADPNAMTSEFETPLHIAIAKQWTRMIDLLLTYKANVNPRVNFCGKTPLLMAIESGNLDIVKTLLVHGASIKLSTINKSTVLHATVKTGNLEMTKLILGHVREDSLILNDADGNMALEIAVNMKFTEIARFLQKAMHWASLSIQREKRLRKARLRAARDKILLGALNFDPVLVKEYDRIYKSVMFQFNYGVLKF